MSHLTIQSLTKSFHGHVALKQLNLEIHDGECFALLGPTGAGKSTALRCIAGLESPDAGHIALNGADVGTLSPAQRDVALVFQQYSLYPTLTVRQNLEFPLKAPTRHFSRDEIDRRVQYAATTLRIEHLLERRTDRLSGGEMQRVSIGRAIVREPQLFLLDEPLSNLDAKLREALREEIRLLRKRLNATMLLVTHDQVEALSMGDRVGVLKAGELVQVGTPDQLYEEPNDVFVAGFIGSPAMNLMTVVCAQDGCLQLPGTSVCLSAPAQPDAPPLEAGKEYVLGIRPEHLHVHPQGSVVGEVQTIEHLGAEYLVSVGIASHTSLRLLVDGNVPVGLGEYLSLAIDLEKIHLFDAVTGKRCVSKTLTERKTK